MCNVRKLLQNLILTRAALRKCRYQREQWINDFPGQLGITCSKVSQYSVFFTLLRAVVLGSGLLVNFLDKLLEENSLVFSLAFGTVELAR